MAISQSVHPESIPLLPRKPPKKPFYRARPLWLVPFAVVSALVRGMTLAPRLEVLTQLACNNLYGDRQWNHTQLATINFSSDIPLPAPIDPLGPHLHPYSLFPGDFFISNLNDSDTDDTEDTPSARCISDPAVQAGAARLQTIMTTTLGLVCVLSSGWWGRFSERHGRTPVLALTTLGSFLTDLMYILVSTPSSPLSTHGHKLILLSPVIEGLLGGFSTLQSATSAYLSDCTSSGSRAHIFSQFSGAMYLGFSIGPVIGGWLISHPWVGGSSTPGRQSVTAVFWVAVFCSFVNFLLAIFLFPESLDKEKKERAMIAYQLSGAVVGKKGKARERAPTSSSGDPGNSSDEDSVEEVNRPLQEGENGPQSGGAGLISHFLSPLAVFLPVVVCDPSGLGRKKRDWSLTLLAGGLFGYFLSTGLYQVKYIYARLIYEWGADQLSYYISFVGGLRALFLLFLLPTFISFYKPKLPPSVQKGKGKPPVLSNSNTSGNTNQSTRSSMVQQPQPQQQSLQKGKKPKPTRAQLGQEIGFDLLLTRFSLMIDILSQTLVILVPAPALTKDHFSLMQSQMSSAKSQAMFVVASSLSCFGSATTPAVHSLALSVLQVRALDAAACGIDGENVNLESKEEDGAGVLFGAFAVLQSVGQTILGSLILGLVFSETVSKWPKAVFAVTGAFLVCALTMVFCVRNPVRPGRSKKGKKNAQGRDIERGRSRVSKDLRGGAIDNYASDVSYNSESSS